MSDQKQAKQEERVRAIVAALLKRNPAALRRWLRDGESLVVESRSKKLISR